MESTISVSPDSTIIYQETEQNNPMYIDLARADPDWVKRIQARPAGVYVDEIPYVGTHTKV